MLYSSRNGRRYPIEGAEGEKYRHSFLCIETLRQKDYRGKSFWRDLQVTEGVSPKAIGQSLR